MRLFSAYDIEALAWSSMTVRICSSRFVISRICSPLRGRSSDSDSARKKSPVNDVRSSWVTVERQRCCSVTASDAARRAASSSEVRRASLSSNC